jgi:hypothetical protein
MEGKLSIAYEDENVANCQGTNTKTYEYGGKNAQKE